VAADEDGDDVIPAEQFFAEIGIAWPPPVALQQMMKRINDGGAP
jgi:hypothetical protein